MVVHDLSALPGAPLVVAEGSTLPAAALSSGAADPTQALWLLPTRAFQDDQLRRRGFPPGPARAYRPFRDVIEREAGAHGVPVLTVDGSLTLEQTVSAVQERLAGALRAGPLAATRAERRALLREANESIVAQLRAFHARPWASGDAETAEREFLCECGDPACEATVALPAGVVAPGPGVRARPRLSRYAPLRSISSIR